MITRWERAPSQRAVEVLGRLEAVEVNQDNHGPVESFEAANGIDCYRATSMARAPSEKHLWRLDR